MDEYYRSTGMEGGRQVVQFASAVTDSCEDDQNLGGPSFQQLGGKNIQFKPRKQTTDQPYVWPNTPASSSVCLDGGLNRKRCKRLEAQYEHCPSHETEGYAESSDLSKDKALELVKAATIHLKNRQGKLHRPMAMIFNESFSGNVPELESQLAEEKLKGTIVRKFRDGKSGKLLICKAFQDAVEINEIQVPLELKDSSYMTQLVGLHWDGLYFKLIQEDAGENLYCVWHKIREQMGSQFVAYIMLDLCQGLNFLHRHGITHRDVKPENLCIAYCQRRMRYFVKLIDYESCKIRQDGNQYNVNINDEYKSLTPEYLPPDFNAFFFKSRTQHERQQERVYPRLGPEDDMYAAGLILAFTYRQAHPMILYHTGVSDYPSDKKEAGKVRKGVLEKIGEMNGLKRLPDWFMEYPICQEMVVLLENLLTLDITKRWTSQEAVDYLTDLLRPCGPPKKSKLALEVHQGYSSQSDTSGNFKLKYKKEMKFTQPVNSATQEWGYKVVDKANRSMYPKNGSHQTVSAELPGAFQHFSLGPSAPKEGHVYQDTNGAAVGAMDVQQVDVSQEEYLDLVNSFDRKPVSASRSGTAARARPDVKVENYPGKAEPPLKPVENNDSVGGCNMPRFDLLGHDDNVISRRGKKRQPKP